MKTKNNTKENVQKEKPAYNQCITCRRGCSMSGMCMRMWPEFVNRAPKGVKNGVKDNKKDS
jgi:hypothetical protein